MRLALRRVRRMAVCAEREPEVERESDGRTARTMPSAGSTKTKVSSAASPSASGLGKLTW
jgi:hypothetical protein